MKREIISIFNIMGVFDKIKSKLGLTSEKEAWAATYEDIQNLEKDLNKVFEKQPDFDENTKGEERAEMLKEVQLLSFKSSKNLLTGHAWNIRDALQGTQIFGGIGSGKTSGSGKAIAKKFLKNNMGGLVLTAVNDELEHWQKMAAETGREKDLIIISPEDEFSFNFLSYFQQHKKMGTTANLVSLLLMLSEINNRSQGGGSDNDGQFWQDSLKEMLMNVIDLLKYADVGITPLSIHKVIAAAPLSLEQANDDEYRTESYLFDLFEAVTERHSELTDSDNEDMEQVVDYWLVRFPSLAQQTRSIIIQYFTGAANYLLRGELKVLFSQGKGDGRTEIEPKESWSGKIFIFNMPVNEYGRTGQIAQTFFKYLWQKVMQLRSREDKNNGFYMPVFLWADEAQYFITSYDADFQQTARHALCCTVYLSQNINNYYKAIGGNDAKTATLSFLGNLTNQIFHANADYDTNKYASDSIGQRKVKLKSTSMNANTDVRNRAQGRSGGMSVSETFRAVYEPSDFTTLKNGGPKNKFVVSAIFKVGRSFGDGRHYRKVSFSQK